MNDVRNATVIIPARYSSRRFPGKPITKILGKPMIQHVYMRAARAKRVRDVWVATDDHRIAEVVSGFGGNVIMTSPNHQSGTQRVFEASERVGGEYIVNLQGDEPLILPEQLDLLIAAMEEDPEADVFTLKVASTDPSELWDPNCVKVVVDHRGYALYFSRAPIPFYKGMWEGAGAEGLPPQKWSKGWIHVGLYGYPRRSLETISSLPPCPWEEAEGLEQLRFLYWGLRIKVLDTEYRTIGVDVPEDVARVEERLQMEGT
jgi:3-deoxy-manno-octulosonate cytidylyltransferase (CMP-KDO synthetase)